MPRDLHVQVHSQNVTVQKVNSPVSTFFGIVLVLAVFFVFCFI